VGWEVHGEDDISIEFVGHNSHSALSASSRSCHSAGVSNFPAADRP
jgi:hypothetical protein